MNAVTLVFVALCVFAVAYRYYGLFIANRVLAVKGDRVTPAVALADGHDYHKTNKFVLFGHHFAAIAAAGPLLGPVLAAQFGYLPGALWIIIGCVLAGAVHDMVVLFASVRHKGKSLSLIAEHEIGKTAGTLASFAVLFILILTLAGLSIAVVNALYESAWGTFTVACTIPIALLMGLYLYKVRPGDVAGASVIGVGLLFLALLAGPHVAAPPSPAGLPSRSPPSRSSSPSTASPRPCCRSGCSSARATTSRPTSSSARSRCSSRASSSCTRSSRCRR